MFDGMIVDKPNDNFDIRDLNKTIGKYLDSHINFIYKPIKNDSKIIPTMPKDFHYNYD